MPLLVSSMETLNSSTFPILHSNTILPKSKPHKPNKVSVKAPPPDFDFRSEILETSTATIAKTHPELLDLASNGSLVLIEKRLFGPVPAWRSAFVEPEAIWLIGTTHISEEAAKEIERVVRAVNPDNVVVELCRSRAGIMYVSEDNDDKRGQQLLRSNMFSLSGSGFFGAVGRSIELGGQTALALRLLLAVFSSKMSSEVSRPFGDEFRAARKASEKVGAQIVLGDRPIEITLERAWNSLTWAERVSFVTSVVRGITSPSDLSQKNIIKDQSRTDIDSAFQLYEQLSFSYPSLLQPLMHERDTYLAWSLKRSKAVNKSKGVVGVIGKGHMNGVIYALVSDQGNLRFGDLAGKTYNNKTATSDNYFSNYAWLTTLFKSLIRDTLIGFFLWALYEQIIRGGLF